MTDDFIVFNIGYIGDPLNEQIDAAVDYIFINFYHVS